jgi:DNA invertase Pin-like site-specific DNA recombinase
VGYAHQVASQTPRRALRGPGNERRLGRGGEQEPRPKARENGSSGVGIVAYVRVSSASQSAEMQRDAIKRAATARGDHIGGWYSETWTGKTTQRAVLDQLRKDVRSGLVKKLYVWRIDRLTRSGIRDTLEIVQELTRHGCDLLTIADGFDLQGPAAEVVLAVMAWAAQMERLAIGERIAAARVRVESTGGSWGRPRRMTTSQLQRARQLASKGRSVREIAVALKVPRTTIYRSLSRKPAQKTTTVRP